MRKSDNLAFFFFTIALTGSRHKTLRTGYINPLLRGEVETVPPGFISNSLESGGIKIRVVDLLPHSEEEHRVLVFQPLLDESVSALKVLHHVRKRDVIVSIPIHSDIRNICTCRP